MVVSEAGSTLVTPNHIIALSERLRCLRASVWRMQTHSSIKIGLEIYYRTDFQQALAIKKNTKKKKLSHKHLIFHGWNMGKKTELTDC